MRTKILLLITATIAVVLLGFAAPAGAQTADVYEEDPEVLDDTETQDPAEVEVLGVAQTQPTSSLPRTGNDLAPLALGGAGAILLGTGFVLYRRRYAAS